MSEKTIRARLNKLGLRLRISTERYTGVKCYAVMDNNGTVMQHSSLEELFRVWKDDLTR